MLIYIELAGCTGSSENCFVPALEKENTMLIHTCCIIDMWFENYIYSYIYLYAELAARAHTAMHVSRQRL